jgi:hypothetical protein
MSVWVAQDRPGENDIDELDLTRPTESIPELGPKAKASLQDSRRGRSSTYTLKPSATPLARLTFQATAGLQEAGERRDMAIEKDRQPTRLGNFDQNRKEDYRPLNLFVGVIYLDLGAPNDPLQEAKNCMQSVLFYHEEPFKTDAYESAKDCLTYDILKWNDWLTDNKLEWVKEKTVHW